MKPIPIKCIDEAEREDRDAVQAFYDALQTDGLHTKHPLISSLRIYSDRIDGNVLLTSTSTAWYRYSLDRYTQHLTRGERQFGAFRQ